MGDLSTAAMVRADSLGMIYHEGEVLPPQLAEIKPAQIVPAAPGCERTRVTL